MKPDHIIGFVLFLLAACAYNARAQVTEPPEVLYERLAPSVVMVGTFGSKGQLIGLGSGVVIGRGQVITNCHVLRKAASVHIKSGNATYRASLRYPDPERDLCQLEVKDLNLPPVEIGSVSQIRIGQRVYDTQTIERIQTTAPIAPGSSGGGLFDAGGRLVGITSSVVRDVGSIGFAIPADWIAELPERAAEQLARFRSTTSGQATAGATSAQTPEKWLTSEELGNVFGVSRELRVSAPSGLQKLVFHANGNVSAEFLTYRAQSGSKQLRSSDQICLTFFVGNRNFNAVLPYLNDCFKVQRIADGKYQFTATSGTFSIVGEM
jgi:serine protease Do